jgi:long-subunit fatty acid transport protein
LFGTPAQFDDRKQVFYSDTALEFLSGTDTDFRFFATASLVKRWSKVVANLSYQRRDSAGSSQGTSSILDTLKLRVDWRPDPQWSVSGQVAYVARTNTSLIPEFQLWIQSVSPVPPGAPVAEANEYRVSTQNSTFDTDTFQTYLTGRYLVNKKLTLNARFLYRMQKSETRTSTQNRDFQVFVLSVGLLYQFDAYRF